MQIRSGWDRRPGDVGSRCILRRLNTLQVNVVSRGRAGREPRSHQETGTILEAYHWDAISRQQISSSED